MRTINDPKTITEQQPSYLASWRASRRKNRDEALAALEAMGLSRAEAALVARSAHLATLQPGELITRLGGYGRAVTLVFSGALEVSRPGDRVFEIRPELSRPEVIGELTALGDQLFQVADVRVVEPAFCVTIHAEKLRNLLPRVPVLRAYIDASHTSRREQLFEESASARVAQYEAYQTYLAALDRIQGS